MLLISFSTPYFDSECLKHIEIASINNVSYINKCEMLLNTKYNFPHSILTTSCTHSLEMMAMLLDIKEGDEVKSTGRIIEVGIISISNKPLYQVHLANAIQNNEITGMKENLSITAFINIQNFNVNWFP